MFLAIAFGLFLAAPLAVLVWSVGRTAVGVSRGEDLAAASALAEAATASAEAPVVVAGRRVTMSKDVEQSLAVAMPVEGTLIEFPMRDAQLAKLRQQYAVRA